MNLRTLNLLALTALLAFASSAGAHSSLQKVKGNEDVMITDPGTREIAITAHVARDCSQPAVCDWGKRAQAFFGSKGGKMEPFFIFVTDVSRAEIDKAIKDVGIESRRMIPKTEVAQHQGLKGTTKKDDYLNGDPVLVVIRYEVDGKKVEVALEDLIEEKITVEGQEVVKPYTPHFVYHGTAEAINFPSGCIVCPSDCNGGIITDNSLPLLTTTSQFRVDWTKMPQPGAKVEVILKSVRGGPSAARSAKETSK